MYRKRMVTVLMVLSMVLSGLLFAGCSSSRNAKPVSY